MKTLAVTLAVSILFSTTHPVDLSFAPGPQRAGATTRDQSVVAAPLIQGVVQLDVAVAEEISAGGLLTYAYTYTNTGVTTATSVTIDANWSNFTTFAGGGLQRCETATCPAVTTAGPSVSIAAPPSGVDQRYVVGSLGPGAGGRFNVLIRIDTDAFPKSGQPIKRPAGSGRLYINNSFLAFISEDTASSLVVGPALIVNKTVTSSLAVYTGEPVQFVITVGNASAPGDLIGGQIRADARAATSVVITEVVPVGASFVAASHGGALVSADRVQWTLVPTLQPGETTSVTLILKKSATAITDCRLLSNSDYKVSSPEYPYISSFGYQAFVPGTFPYPSVVVIPPLQVGSPITVTPSPVYYGNIATATLVARNYLTAAVSGVKLEFVLPNNASIVAGSAEPASASESPPNVLGGVVTWVFSMPAGSKILPAERTFTVRFQASFANSTQSGSAKIIEADDGVPTTCSGTGFSPAIVPRLEINKLSAPRPIFNSAFIVRKFEQFPYTVTVRNLSNFTATGLTVNDYLPATSGAAFAYLPGTATLNGVSREPDAYVPVGGVLSWNNITVPANSTATFVYQVRVDGYDIQKYCNEIEVLLGQEPVNYLNRKVCTTIQPNLSIIKTGNKTSAIAGEEVEFNLSITNLETRTISIGLADYSNSFEFVRQVSGYGTPVTFTGGVAARTWAWPIVNLASSQSLNAVVVMRMPNPCNAPSYDNELGFQMEPIPGTTFFVVQVPPVKHTVTCGYLEYSKSAAPSDPGLRAEIAYDLQLKNTHKFVSAQFAAITDVLPIGFTFVRMDINSQIGSAPSISTRPDGRIQLVWSVSIPADSTRSIRFIARTGESVGQRDNWLVASVSGLDARCGLSCQSITDTGKLIKYSVAVAQVTAHLTLAIEGDSQPCLSPGALRMMSVALLNSDVSRGYAPINISVSLPFGFKYSGVLSGTTAPIVTSSAGIQTLQWSNLSIAAKPPGSVAAQTNLIFQVSAGASWMAGPVTGNASTPLTLIPQRAGSSDPELEGCNAPIPIVIKQALLTQVQAGDDLIYAIDVLNPMTTPFNITLSDVLPADLALISAVTGTAPTLQNGALVWTSRAVPAGQGNSPGILSLGIRTYVSQFAGGRITNTLTAQATTPLDLNEASVGVNVIALPTATPTRTPTPTATPVHTPTPTATASQRQPRAWLPSLRR